MVNVTIYSIHGSYGLCIYQIIKIGTFPPSSYSAPPARGTFPSRHQTENSWLRNEGFTVCREPGLQWFPRRNSNRTPIQPGIIWGYLGIIWGLFWLYFGYAIGGINKSTNSRPVITGHQTPKRWPDHSETGCGERTITRRQIGTSPGLQKMGISPIWEYHRGFTGDWMRISREQNTDFFSDVAAVFWQSKPLHSLQTAQQFCLM